MAEVTELDKRIWLEKKLMHAKIDSRMDEAFKYIEFKFIEFGTRFRCGPKLSFDYARRIPTRANLANNLMLINGIGYVEILSDKMFLLHHMDYKYQILVDELIGDVKSFLNDFLPMKVHFVMRMTSTAAGDRALLLTLK